MQIVALEGDSRMHWEGDGGSETGKEGSPPKVAWLLDTSGGCWGSGGCLVRCEDRARLCSPDSDLGSGQPGTVAITHVQ